MSNKTYAVLIGAVVLILGVVTFIRYGSERAQAPAVTDMQTATTTESATTSDAYSATATETSVDSPRPAPSTGTQQSTQAPGTYTMAQVAANANASACWTVVAGTVYDVTAWIAKHPGGSRAILSMCGTDATASFTRQHGSSANAQAALAQFRIGALAQ